MKRKDLPQKPSLITHVEVYMDDMLVKSSREMQHLNDLQ